MLRPDMYSHQRLAVVVLACAAVAPWILRLADFAYNSSKTDPFTCARSQWSVRFVLHDPLVAHIEKFVSQEERRYLLALA